VTTAPQIATCALSWCDGNSIQALLQIVDHCVHTVRQAQGCSLLLVMQISISNCRADGIHIVASYFITHKVKEINSVCHTHNTQVHCKVCLGSWHSCCMGGH